MKLSDAERGMLISKMADETIASIFGRRVSWVKKARAWLAEEAAKPAEPRPEAGCILRIRVVEQTPPESEFCTKPEKAPEIVHQPLRQIDLEEAIAAATPYRFDAPAQLEGSELASWLYDNSTATFTQIAELSGLEPEEVQAIANGDELPEPAPMKAMRQKIVRRPPPSKPAKVRMVSPPPRPHAEIPPRVIRWARQFRDAHWTWGEISYLFEVDIGDLRHAMGLDPLMGQRVA